MAGARILELVVGYIQLSELHLQASLGETKKDKGSESVTVYAKFGDQKLVIGNMSAESIPQIQYDLVFEKEFELSHNWKKGSVFFVGYKTVLDEGYPFCSCDLQFRS